MLAWAQQLNCRVRVSAGPTMDGLMIDSVFLMLLVMFVIIMYVPLSACRIPNVAVVNVKWLATVVPGAWVSRTLQEQC